jgi:phosphatidylethanolamine/phosphatidyl-N-methylethanolamine N-methyltransferase
MGTKDRRYWERHARAYDVSLKFLARPIPRMLHLIDEAITGSDRVLEVAAGTGLVTPTLARVAREVIATDYASAMVEILRKRVREARLANVHCEQADIYALRFGPQTFDAVVAANVLHLLPDLRQGILALARVLKPNGRLVVPTFCHDETWCSRSLSRVLAVTGFPTQRRFAVVGLRATLEELGLEVTRLATLKGLIPIGYAEGHFK